MKDLLDAAVGSLCSIPCWAVMCLGLLYVLFRILRSLFGAKPEEPAESEEDRKNRRDEGLLRKEAERQEWLSRDE
jgi:hypothetical protein